MDPARLEQIEARAIVSMARAAPDDIVAMLDLRTGVAGGAHCVRSHIPDRTFNHAIGIGPDVELDIDALEAWWEGATQPWVVSPLPGSQNESRLRDRGYVDDYAWMKFARPTADPPIPPPQAPAIRVAGSADAADAGRVIGTAFGMPEPMFAWVEALVGEPGWTCVISQDATAAGTLFVADGTGWLGSGGVVPEGRGRGSQAALLAARIALAREQGCDIVVTETGERIAGKPAFSYRNILGAGFAEQYLRPNLRLGV